MGSNGWSLQLRYRIQSDFLKQVQYLPGALSKNQFKD
jgi:hypothetical protein